MCSAGGASILLLLTVALSIQDAMGQSYGLVGVSGMGRRPVDACPGFSLRACDAGTGFIIGTDSCVTFINEEKSYEEAERACRDRSSTLVSLDNIVKYRYLFCSMEHIEMPYLRIWVGAKRQDDGSFLWVNNAVFRPDIWLPGQPDNYMGEENCVEMNWRVPSWFNDDGCWKKKPFFCEKHLA